MGAIAGIVALHESIDAEASIRALMQRMAHRAPDGRRVVGGPGMALGHGALLATPTARAGLQPLQAGEWLLAVDGRIDDRDDLFRQLQLGADDGCPDEALWAAAWQRWGAQLGLHVVGDFAVAAWHIPSRTLWLVRDRVGVRPLYWVHPSRVFAFASEAEPLLSLPNVSSTPDPDRVRYYLAPVLGDGDPAGSWYRDVRKLRPGHWLKLEVDGGVETGCWWRPQPLAPLQLRDRREYQDAFLEVFGAAVRCRLKASGKPALMLSGGIDSAAVLAMIRRGRPGVDPGCQVVSVVSDRGPQCPETANILQMHAAEPDVVSLPVPSMAGRVDRHDFARLPWSPAHPVDNSLLLPMLVYRAVQAMGGRVVLDGMDGDLVMWSRKHRAARLVLAGQWRAGWREAQRSARTHTYLQGLSPASILARGLLGRLQPTSVVALRHARVISSPRPALGPGLSARQIRMGQLGAQLWRQRVDRHRATARLTHAEGLADVWEHVGLFRGMEGMDHLAARFGIEPRHPWSDQRVLDFFLRLPEEQVAADGWTKYIARAACEPWLGRDVAWHSGKGHLGHQLADAAVDHARGRLLELLAPHGVLADWVEEGALAKVRQAVADGGGGLPALDLGTLAAWIAALDEQDFGYDLG